MTTCVTTALGADVPVVVAPAMHEPMYDHPGVLDAIDRVASWGVEFVDPRIEEGKAKIATEEAIVTATARAAGDRPLADEHVVVTAGATTESVDPVRTLSNRSSGRTGRAVARACYVRGADVTLVHDGPDVPYATVERVESAAEMTAATRRVAGSADALISAAAISDFTVEQAPEKISSAGADADARTRAEAHRHRPRRPPGPPHRRLQGRDRRRRRNPDRARPRDTRAGRAGLRGRQRASVMGDDETRALLVDADAATEYVGEKQGLGARAPRTR